MKGGRISGGVVQLRANRKKVRKHVNVEKHKRMRRIQVSRQSAFKKVQQIQTDALWGKNKTNDCSSKSRKIAETFSKKRKP